MKYILSQERSNLYDEMAKQISKADNSSQHWSKHRPIICPSSNVIAAVSCVITALSNFFGSEIPTLTNNAHTHTHTPGTASASKNCLNKAQTPKRDHYMEQLVEATKLWFIFCKQPALPGIKTQPSRLRVVYINMCGIVCAREKERVVRQWVKDNIDLFNCTRRLPLYIYIRIHGLRFPATLFDSWRPHVCNPHKRSNGSAFLPPQLGL